MGKLTMLSLLILMLPIPAPAQRSMNWAVSESGKIQDFQTMFEPKAIRTLLESMDSREQAWGAWLAGQSQYGEGTIPLLQRIVKIRLEGSDWRTDGLPLDAALDALILLDAKVPIDVISAIYQKRPAPALVLVSKLESGCDDFLLDLAREEKGTKWFAAANLLLSHHTPGTAAVLLRDLEITAEITVIRGKEFPGIAGGGAGGSSGDGALGRIDGYPPMAYYYLTDSAWNGGIVLAVGPRTVYYRRNMMRFGSSPAGPTHIIFGPGTGDRLKYVQALLGGSRDLPLKATEFRSHKWQGQNTLELEIDNFKQDILNRYSVLIRMLVDRKLLRVEDASHLPEPAIKVQINDLRSGSENEDGSN